MDGSLGDTAGVGFNNELDDEAICLKFKDVLLL